MLSEWLNADVITRKLKSQYFLAFQRPTRLEIPGRRFYILERIAGSLRRGNEVAPFRKNGRPSPCQPLRVFTTQTPAVTELWRGAETLRKGSENWHRIADRMDGDLRKINLRRKQVRQGF